jgi:hypothetical protein
MRTATTAFLCVHGTRPLQITPRFSTPSRASAVSSARHQDASGSVIDVYLHREVQYATPYFAYAVGTLAKAGRSRDLLPRGIAAIEHSTNQFALGRQAIPDQHGEFFIASLTEALDLYYGLVPEEALAHAARYSNCATNRHQPK